MSHHHHDARPGRGWILDACLLGLAGVLVIGWWNTPRLHTFSVLFSSIVLEALMFVLIGSIVGGLIEVYVPRELIVARMPARSSSAVFVGAAMGMLLPVCECAIVPIVRRLVGKGVPMSAAVAFLLAGPIVNPLVFASTLVAYQFDWRIAALRLVFGYGIAVGVAWTAGRLWTPESLFANGGSPCCDHERPAGTESSLAKARRALLHGYDDFVDVGRYLIMGAFAAALIQTLVARDAIVPFAEHSTLAVGSMMVLAVVLNLCSEADAFVAASLDGIVAFPGQMAFMVLGPMLDLKLLMMYLTLFRRRAVFRLAGLTALTVGVTMLVFGAIWGPVR